MTKQLPLEIPVVDWPGEPGERLMAELRQRLSPQGDIVSEMGRQRTVELFGESLSPQQVIEKICSDVAREGLKAVLDYTARLDGKKLTAETVRVPPNEFAAAHAQAQPAYLATLRRVVANITEFQSSLLNRDVVLRKTLSVGGQIELRQRYVPLRRIGICIPGGAAAYPSTLLMTAIPARVAGVREIAVVVPPTPFGGYNSDILAACHELRIGEVYRIGGAQGVAALAYGVEGIERVDKIVGPGNLFVALAKQHVFGDVDIDSIAGPSEVVVLADESARPDFVASDLISQSEHSPGSAILITWHPPLVPLVKAALEEQLSRVDRGNLARASLEQYGALVVVSDAAAAARLSDSLAPEHLHISTAAPEKLLALVQNAGAIFLGHDTPVAVGDYVAGPSHVLPTGGTARFANGLCANDFLKRSSIISYDKAALQFAADDIRLLAAKEGLTAHSASVDVRFTPPEGETAGGDSSV
jgi:histidinol dehydrogenase